MTALFISSPVLSASVILEISASTSVVSWNLEPGSGKKLRGGVSHFCGCQRMIHSGKREGLGQVLQYLGPGQ